MDMHYPYQLPPRPYAYEALSQHQRRHASLHHDKHFQTYVDNLNTALADCPECQSKPLDELLKKSGPAARPQTHRYPQQWRRVYNHLLYFDGMCACHSSRPSGGLARWPWSGTSAPLRLEGTDEGRRSGPVRPGYAWLVSETSGKLSVMKLPNQDCPLSMGLWPVLCLDVGSMPTI